MTDKSVKFSARVLLDYLAGRIDQAEFQRQSGLFFGRRQGPGPSVFELWLRQGRLIANIELERCPEKDDDWIIITFSEPDPAVSKFVPPRQTKDT